MRLMTVIGARPQFVKAAVVSRCFANHPELEIHESVIHTGQHYDANMSSIFFDELGLPVPKYNLGISASGHGAMTGRMLEKIEELLLVERPDCLLVYGDTNSTLAGALAAAKLKIPVAHIEAGLRSFNMAMPEEINRILTDRISSQLFCPTGVAVENLRGEGLTHGVFNVGDVMYDAALTFADIATRHSTILDTAGIAERFVLVTCHRAENTDDPTRLKQIVGALSEISDSIQVVLPLHPRTRKVLEDRNWDTCLADVKVLPPVSFLDMIRLEQRASVILTDSGGVQKEAFFYGVPCVTMRDETEWVETTRMGWNTLVGANRDAIVQSVLHAKTPSPSEEKPYGSGLASEAIARLLSGMN